MKKLLTILCVAVLLCSFTACGEKEDAKTVVSTEQVSAESFVGKYESPEAKVMGSEATLEIMKNGTFIMETSYEKNSSTITGTYTTMSANQILITPAKQVTVESGEKKETDMSEAGSILAELNGDKLTVGTGTTEEVVYNKIK